MIRILWLLVLVFTAFSAQAETYQVIFPDTPQAHIKLQPQQGVYLGQMMRNIGLQPDWTNREWVTLIHDNNPDQVDSKGEILFHHIPLRVPLNALAQLKGYQLLQTKLEKVPVAPLPPAKIEEPKPVAKDLPPSPLPALENIPPPDELLSFHSQLGFGTALIKAEDVNINQVDLNSEFVGLLTLGLRYRNDVHRIELDYQGTYQSFVSPPNTTYTVDQTFLNQVNGVYAYAFSEIFSLGLAFRSEELNWVQFPIGGIDIVSDWIHSVGLKFSFTMLDMGESELRAEALGLVAFENPVDPTASSTPWAFQLDIHFQPEYYKAGWLFTLSTQFNEALPVDYSGHQTIRMSFLGGYRF